MHLIIAFRGNISIIINDILISHVRIQRLHKKPLTSIDENVLNSPLHTHFSLHLFISLHFVSFHLLTWNLITMFLLFPSFLVLIIFLFSFHSSLFVSFHRINCFCFPMLSFTSVIKKITKIYRVAFWFIWIVY